MPITASSDHHDDDADEEARARRRRRRASRRCRRCGRAGTTPSPNTNRSCGSMRNTSPSRHSTRATTNHARTAGSSGSRARAHADQQHHGERLADVLEALAARGAPRPSRRPRPTSARASSRKAAPVTPRHPTAGRRGRERRPTKLVSASISARHRMTLAGWFMPSTPTTPAAAAVERHEAPLVDAARHHLDVVVGRRRARPAGSCGRTGRTRTTGSARTARRAGAGQRACWAAWVPIAMALSQCSTRMTSSKRRFGQRATSPAATTPGRGGAGGVAHHAVVDRQARALEPVGVRARRRCRPPRGRRRARRRR